MSVQTEAMELRLSICIPTYNFGEFVGETLQSVLCQIQAGVEIIVLDSASTDNTRAIVCDLQKQHKCLRYEYAPMRGGIDRDLARLISLARGQYCWMFSADDLMVSGALAKVLIEIERTHDLFICTHSDESLTMQLIAPKHAVLRVSEDTSFELAHLSQQLQYFGLARTTEAFFSFISGLIIRREKWNQVALNEHFVGSCWAHVARLFELIPRGLAVRFLTSTLVRRRGDNDSFATQGVVRRYALAIQGYQSLASYFWGDKSCQAFDIRRVLRNEFRLRAFIAAKALCIANPDKEDKALLDSLMKQAYSDMTISCLASRIVYRIFPNAIYLSARKVYKFILRALDKQ